MAYFTNIQSIEDLKAQYKKLARQHHPDLGGSLETMQEINAEYDRLFKKYEHIHKNANGQTYEKAESHEAPEQFRNIIESLLKFDITIDLVGSWIWVTGNTFTAKETLKELGFKWASRKKAWYWHSQEEVARRKSKMSLAEIKDKYGCESFKGKQQVLLA